MSINTDTVKELFFKANGRSCTDDELATLRQSLNDFSWIGKSAVTYSKPIGPPTELHLRKENICFLISNRFENSNQHPLTHYKIDEENITKTFSWLNFRVEKRTNLSTGKIKSFIDSISKVDYTDSECIVLFILSHGNDKGEIVGSDNKLLKLEEIIKRLQEIETLNGKPKLIFVQACRGEEEEKPVEVEMVTAGSKAILKAQKSDTFVYYCTMPGTVSYVSSVVGSFFFNKLCAVLHEYCRNPRYHFGDVVTKVNDELSTYVRTHQPKEKVKRLVQVSEACSSLTAHLYFHPKGTYEDFIAEFIYKE